MSGDEVARLLRIERGTYYRIERGAQTPGVETSLRIALYLGWTMSEVVAAARTPLQPDE